MASEAVGQFCDITGADPAVAVRALEVAGGQLETAIQLFYDNPALQNVLEELQPPPSAYHSSTQSRQILSREVVYGAVHIISDDEGDDDAVTVNGRHNEGDGPASAWGALRSQEEVDAVIAKSMQEDLYAEGQTADQVRVRSPIRRRTETLIAPESWDSDIEGLNYSDTTRHRAMLDASRTARLSQTAHDASPFNQSIWNNVENVATGLPGLIAPSLDHLAYEPQLDLTRSAQNVNRTQRLAELFRPPYEIMSRMSWDSARKKGKQDRKWLIVNLQDMSIFACQTVNRDIWRHGLVRRLIQEHFVFLQYTVGDPMAEQYTNFYVPHHSHENADNYPHVSIIDPRTGEQQRVFGASDLSDADGFCDKLVQFLDMYSLSDNSKNPIGLTQADAQQDRPLNIDLLTEDEMFEIAMQNSLRSARGTGIAVGKTAGILPTDLKASNLYSDQFNDSPTRFATPAAFATLYQDTKASAVTGESSQGDFAGISRTRPQTEPEDAALTTRIQFRHPGGRVIRRFKLKDRVARIYEWLKSGGIADIYGAEMAEAKFELKSMPQCLDLISLLDLPIEKAGLKQGTVMIELVTD